MGAPPKRSLFIVAHWSEINLIHFRSETEDLQYSTLFVAIGTKWVSLRHPSQTPSWKFSCRRIVLYLCCFCFYGQRSVALAWKLGPSWIAQLCHFLKAYTNEEVKAVYKNCQTAPKLNLAFTAQILGCSWQQRRRGKD